MALQSKRNYSPIEKRIDKQFGCRIETSTKFKLLKEVIHDMDYGSKRRKLILELLSTGIEFQVNGMHCIQIKNDPDIKKLIKSGKIEMFNTPSYNWGSSKCKHTYIRIKNG